MRRTYLVSSVLLALALCALVILLSPNPRIVVEKQAVSAIRPGITAYVQVYCDNRKPKESPLEARGSAYLEDAIVDRLRLCGVSRSINREESDFGVECHYRNALCLPYLGRHWDIHTSAIYRVSIRLVERKTDRVIADVEYRRAPLRRPAQGFVQDMLYAAGVISTPTKGSVLER